MDHRLSSLCCQGTIVTNTFEKRDTDFVPESEAQVMTNSPDSAGMMKGLERYQEEGAMSLVAEKSACVHHMNL